MILEPFKKIIFWDFICVNHKITRGWLNDDSFHFWFTLSVTWRVHPLKNENSDIIYSPSSSQVVFPQNSNKKSFLTPSWMPTQRQLQSAVWHSNQEVFDNKRFLFLTCDKLGVFSKGPQWKRESRNGAVLPEGQHGPTEPGTPSSIHTFCMFLYREATSHLPFVSSSWWWTGWRV